MEEIIVEWWSLVEWRIVIFYISVIWLIYLFESLLKSIIHELKEIKEAIRRNRE